MVKRIKSIIFIVIILVTLFSSWNLELGATGDSKINSISRSIDRRNNEDYNWSQIEVISEPIVGKNLNINTSGWPKIAAENDKLYVVWEDGTNTDGAGLDNDIFFRYFDGNKWSKIQVISEPQQGYNKNINHSFTPDIAVDNGRIFVVWVENNTNNAGEDLDIFYRCNITGNSWEDIQVISEPIPGKNYNTKESNSPAIAADNGRIYIVWHDFNDTNGCGGSPTDSDIFYRCNLTGSNWETVQVISEPVAGKNFNTIFSRNPAIAVENDKIYVVWDDYNETNGASWDDDIFFLSNLTGSSWEDVKVISEPVFGKNFNDRQSGHPAIAVENSNIYVAWHDGNDTNGAGHDADIFYRCYLTESSWGSIQVISEPEYGKDSNNKSSLEPEIAVDKGKIHIVWWDNNDTNNADTDPDIFYRCNLTGKSWEDIQVISEPVFGSGLSYEDARFPDIVADSSKCHVVWRDENDTNGAAGDGDIFYRTADFLPIRLKLPNVEPTLGYTSTIFNYTVKYIHLKNYPPNEIIVNISGSNYSMFEVDPSDINYKDGKNYYFKTKLNISLKHTYQFSASDGNYNISTAIFNGPYVYNSPPAITTEDNLTAIEDTYYEVIYEYEDIDEKNIGQLIVWQFNTNATWLKFNSTMGTLYGTPLNEDAGEFWVELIVYDTIDIDFTNFTLTVIDVNALPIIITSYVEITYEDELYKVDYNAIDIDSPINAQIWALNTNASSWLGINTKTGIVSGVPTNDEVGTYWVNVSVNDTENGEDAVNYTLIVLNVNDPPIIMTEDIVVAQAGELYNVDYEAIDIDPTNDTLTWSLVTNASWLSIESFTGALAGVPTVDEIGVYGVNVSVNDGNGGLDWHNFILSVIRTNLPPIILTEDQLTAEVNITYSVDYEATDDYTPTDKLVWALKTNASWLSIEANTGALSGTPTEPDIGKYWVNVSVTDGEDGWDYHYFIITVTMVPIEENKAPELTNPTLTPSEGDLKTEFTFSVHYFDADNDAPTFIQVVIDNEPYNMTLKTSNASNGTYEYSTKISELGIHTYYFTASDGVDIVSTENFTVTVGDNKVGEKSEESGWFGLIWIVILIVIVVLILLFVFLKRKKSQEELGVPAVNQPISVGEPIIEEEMEE